MRVLVNAYACSPNMGSEPGMAWNWCVNLANYCELFIITEGEFKDKIEAVIPTLPQGMNMHFYYNSVSDRIRKMCWNQGDWRFYYYYRLWQKKTLAIAEDICRQFNIDIIHQLNMIGFREPGYLWKISGVPFVWGPIGGLKLFPTNYLEGADWKMRLFNYVKNHLNILQLRYGSRVNKAIKHASLLISSIPDSYHALKKYKNVESVIIPETGCHILQGVPCVSNEIHDEVMRLLWVGKFDFRKQLDIALKTIASLKPLEHLQLVVCGTGSKEQVNYYHLLADKLGIAGKIEWRGQLDHYMINEEMKKAELFFFTSVSEDTSTVVMEAISNCLPVLCHDACGFGYVVNGNVGLKIPLSSPQQSVKDFASQIEKVYHHRQLLRELAENCVSRQKELSWDKKSEQVYNMYKQLLQ